MTYKAMTKKFIYFAFAVMTAMCMTTACSSDDDEETPKDYEVNLPTPPNASNAVQYTLTTPMISSSTIVNAPVLKTIDITESSEVLLELYNLAKAKTFYVKEKATINGNTYTFNGSKVKGTIKVVDAASRLTRSDATVLEINIVVTASETEVYTFVNEVGETVTATKETPVTGDAILDRLSRTWNILGVIIDLKGGDVKAYEEWDAVGGVLDLETTALQEAIDQGVKLTEQEKNDLKKKVKSVSFTKTGLFSIDYADGKEDVANWKWSNSDKTQFMITLKDKEMGNKFIDNNSRVDFAFNGDRCNMKLSTVFKDSNNKEWDVVLTLKLKS